MMRHFNVPPTGRVRAFRGLCFGTTLLLSGFCAVNAQAEDGKAWAATWTALQQGVFAEPAPATVVPVGDFRPEVFFPQPNAIRFALPGGKATGQTFRMMVRPDIWSDTVRIRFSNVFGTEPLVIGSAAVGLQEYSAHLVTGTSVGVMFDGKPSVTIAPGERLFSDPVALPFYSEAALPLLRGRNLAVSFAVTGCGSAPACGAAPAPAACRCSCGGWVFDPHGSFLLGNNGHSRAICASVSQKGLRICPLPAR